MATQNNSTTAEGALHGQSARLHQDQTEPPTHTQTLPKADDDDDDENSRGQVDDAPAAVRTLAARLPRGFVFGAATSAYQIEGSPSADGKVPSIWDTWCLLGKTDGASTGEVACDHYRLWREDCAMMKRMGLGSYRFSIAWTRVVKETRFDDIDGSATVVPNEAGIGFYRALMETLVAEGIEPMPTLYHWDLPQAIQDSVGGWLSESIVDAFAAYARLCFERLGSLARRWTTFNEPYVVAHYGHGVAESPPGVRGYEYLAAHHMLLAHAQVANLYRRKFATAWGEANGDKDARGAIGIVLNCAWREPADPYSEADSAAAALCVDQRFGWFAEPLRSGRYPECLRDALATAGPDGARLAFTDNEARMLAGSVDFVGLNYYTTKRISAAPSGGGGFVEVPPVPGTPINALGWAVAPAGLGRLIDRAAATFPTADLWITENGFADDEAMTGAGIDAAINDSNRIHYLASHLEQVASAIERGARVRGYLAWSLLDNFEWNMGYRPRFGLVHVDFSSPERPRTLKASAVWYADLISAHAAEGEL